MVVIFLFSVFNGMLDEGSQNIICGLCRCHCVHCCCYHISSTRVPTRIVVVRGDVKITSAASLGFGTCIKLLGVGVVESPQVVVIQMAVRDFLARKRWEREAAAARDEPAHSDNHTNTRRSNSIQNNSHNNNTATNHYQSYFDSDFTSLRLEDTMYPSDRLRSDPNKEQVRLVSTGRNGASSKHTPCKRALFLSQRDLCLVGDRALISVRMSLPG